MPLCVCAYTVLRSASIDFEVGLKQSITFPPIEQLITTFEWMDF